jgi:hypothetical protein
MSHMSMAEWVDWLACGAPYILHQAPVHHVFKRLFGFLRRGVLYFAQFSPGQHTEEQIDSAQRDLLNFAELLQQLLGPHRHLTFLLHVIVVHIAEQVRRCGASALMLERWIERLMQTPTL